MTAHAKIMDSAQLHYRTPAGESLLNWRPNGDELNGNNVAASTLHAVGIDIAPYLEGIAKLKGLDLKDNLPRGGDFVFVENVAAMTIDDVLHGSIHRDIIWGGACCSITGC